MDARSRQTIQPVTRRMNPQRKGAGAGPNPSIRDLREFDLVGESPAFLAAAQLILRMAACGVPVLLRGHRCTRVPVLLPPLRERAGDVKPLFDSFRNGRSMNTAAQPVASTSVRCAGSIDIPGPATCANWPAWCSACSCCRKANA